MISFFPCNVGSLASVFSQFPNKTLSSLFGTKSIAKKVNNQYLIAMKVRTRTMRLTISSLFKLSLMVRLFPNIDPFAVPEFEENRYELRVDPEAEGGEEDEDSRAQ
jgi:hypothetical protein